MTELKLNTGVNIVTFDAYVTNIHRAKTFLNQKKPVLWEYNVICDINNLSYRSGEL